MQVSADDPGCDWTTHAECPYTLDGVTITAGANWTPPPLVIIDFEPGDDPYAYYGIQYPDDNDWSDFAGSSLGSNSRYLYGKIVEKSCDPKVHGCLLPLISKDSTFLLKVMQGNYFKTDADIPTQEERDECHAMEDQLMDLIDQTFNRPANDTTHGIYRGNNGAAYQGNMEVHGGAEFNGSFHLDGYEWDGAFNADSSHVQPRLVTMMLHEAAHVLGKKHPDTGNYNPLDYDYFKYTIIDNKNSCVWNWPYGPA